MHGQWGLVTIQVRHDTSIKQHTPLHQIRADQSTLTLAQILCVGRTLACRSNSRPLNSSSKPSDTEASPLAAPPLRGGVTDAAAVPDAPLVLACAIDIDCWAGMLSMLPADAKEVVGWDRGGIVAGPGSATCMACTCIIQGMCTFQVESYR